MTISTDTRVVVLGGTSGIGLATAKAVAAAGASIVVASPNPASVKSALAELPERSEGYTVDASSSGQLASFFDVVGELDHLVFTVGEPLTFMPVHDLDLDRARSFFTLRYFGALAAVRAAAPHVRPGGSITLTTGTAGDRPGAGWSVAASVCGAVDSLTRALAVELAPIRVNAVKPGVVRSPLWTGLDDATREQLYRDTAAAIPIGRVGEVDDIARAYLYLITEPFATGSIVTVDGGTVLA